MKIFASIILAFALIGCTTTATTVRQASKITLEGVETAQEVLIVYGSLPDCGGAIVVCKDPVLWGKLKKSEAAVVAALVKAQPVLNGSAIDNGELLELFSTIETMKNLVKEIKTPWRKP